VLQTIAQVWHFAAASCLLHWFILFYQAISSLQSTLSTPPVKRSIATKLYRFGLRFMRSSASLRSNSCNILEKKLFCSTWSECQHCLWSNLQNLQMHLMIIPREKSKVYSFLCMPCDK
jgi:hypothetical protein